MHNFIFFRLLLFAFLLATMTGCELVGDIFEAGFWVGVILVFAVIVVIFWLFKKLMD